MHKLPGGIRMNLIHNLLIGDVQDVEIDFEGRNDTDRLPLGGASFVAGNGQAKTPGEASATRILMRQPGCDSLLIVE